MGYEATRFIHDVDDEFYCSICNVVLKEPTQSPCDHLFCSECIKGWLAVDQSCPVERGPLKLEDLKPASRTVRNFVNKFEIKCDFESKGCAAIVKLENLQDHIGRCDYNPNATIICDKGCDSEMRRHQYEKNNCFKHLVDLQREKFEKLNDEVVSLRDEVMSLRCEQEDSVNQMIRQNDKIATLSDQVKNQSTEIQRLNDEVNLRGDTISRLNNDSNKLPIKETSKLSDEMSNATNDLVNVLPEFRLWFDMKISTGQLNVLEAGNGCGLVQSLYALEPTKYSFKIEILSLKGFIRIGLTPLSPSSFRNAFSSYWRRSVWSHGGTSLIWVLFSKLFGKWKAGDIIECGINFHRDFVNDGRRVQCYLKKNGESIHEGFAAMPKGGLFPLVFMEKGSKIRILRN